MFGKMLLCKKKKKGMTAKLKKNLKNRQRAEKIIKTAH